MISLLTAVDSWEDGNISCVQSTSFKLRFTCRRLSVQTAMPPLQPEPRLQTDAVKQLVTQFAQRLFVNQISTDSNVSPTLHVNLLGLHEATSRVHFCSQSAPGLLC